MPESWWNRLSLEALSAEQWEQLCDGCGQCCLHVLQDENTGCLLRTAVHCRFLDAGRCRCTDYDNRANNVPECLILTPATAREFDWLPQTCAYRLRARGLPLYAWHPLESGSADSVREAGVSVHDRVISEEFVPADHLDEYVLNWIEQGTE